MSAILDFAREELGLTLTPAQAEMLSTFADGGYSTAVWQCGRRGGKSLLADVLALYDACLRGHLRERLRPGEPRVSGIVTPRLDQAEMHIRTIRGLLDASPRLRRMVVAEHSDSLTFSTGAEVRAMPCSARSIRGAAWSSAILDELGHFVTLEASNAAGDRVLEAVLPAVAQFDRAGWVVAISTPLWKQGAFWSMVERARSGRSESTHYRHLSTAEMNPHVAGWWLDERRREDAEMFAREFEARFIDGASSYLPAGEVLAAVRGGVGNLAARPGVQYVAALDPAFSMDAFAMSVAHREADQRVIVDGLRAWRKLGYEAVLDEVRDLARAYGVRRLRTDQASAEPIRAGLARRGLAADYRAWSNESKRDAFAALKVALNTGGIELPDDKALVSELCGLEARPTPSGMTRIAAAGSGHDDRAVVVASVVADLTRRVTSPERVRSLAGLNQELRTTAGWRDGLDAVLGGGGRWPS